MSFPPQKYGRYFVYDKIAVGGMAEIFKARLCGAENFQKTLVIKRLNCIKNAEYAQKLFIDEAHLCADLTHPNIVQTYDFSCVRDQYFIAMEYIEGQDLKQLLVRTAQNRLQFPVDLALFIAHELCAALSYVHDKKNKEGKSMGLIHRDISPANILISYLGEIKLADFGIAKNAFRLYESNPGIIKGKYEYMSPEQAKGEELDHRSDIFCVGILLYEMLTGRRLFKSNSDTEAIQKVQECNILAASSINQRISYRLNQIIHTSLEKNPALRYQSADSMRLALLEVLHPKSRRTAFEELGVFMNNLFHEEIEKEKQEEKTVRARLKQIENHQLDLPPKTKETKVVSQNLSKIVTKEKRDYPPIVVLLSWILTIIFASLWLLKVT